MAAGTMVVTKKELLELLEQYEDYEPIGYVFSVAKDGKSPEHQVVMLYDSIANLL